MSTDLLLRPTCDVRGCGSTSDLYGSNCKHMTLCFSCGKTMAENKAKCHQCDAIVTRLIREYNVRLESTISNKNYFIGKFGNGLPNFSKTKIPSQDKWYLRKDVQDSRKNEDEEGPKTWILDEQRGQSRYQGHREGAQFGSYYLLMRQGKEFSAAPAGFWFNFNKVAQYKQLTLEEAEEKMDSRQRSNRDGNKRWSMKLGKGPDEATGDVDGGGEGKLSNNEKEETTRKRYNFGIDKKGGDVDEDDNREGASEDEDLHDDGSDKGSDWEHEELFSDDDEAVGNPDERDDFEHETPAPPVSKQDEDGNEEEVGLSESGKELKKLLRRRRGLNGIDREEEEDEDEDEDDDDDDDDDEDDMPEHIGSPKQKEKRKLDGDEAHKASNTTASKKMKTENQQKPSVTEKPTAPEIGVLTPSMNTGSVTSPVSEEQIRALLVQKSAIPLHDFIENFFAERRKYSKEQKDAFAKIVREVSRKEKKNGISYIVLKKK